MKNILIFGAPRSGKSTLGAKLSKEQGYNWIPFDAVKEFAKQLHKPLKIDKDIMLRRSKLYAPAVVSLMKGLEVANRGDNGYFVLEGANFDLDQILPQIDREKWIFVCMAYPFDTAESKMEEIKKYLNNTDFVQNVKPFPEGIEYSKHIFNLAKEHNVKFVDAGVGKRNEAIKDVLEYIGEEKTK